MKYHLFECLAPYKDGAWSMFLYKTPETCVEAWSYDPRYGLHVYKKDDRDIPIDKRIFILSTTQHGQLPDPSWKYKEVTETDAYFMMFDT